MTKKEILVSVVVIIVIAVIGVGGFFAWNRYHNWKLSVEMVEDEKRLANATPPSDSISLSTAEKDTSDTSGLKVDTGTNSVNPAQLGSGQTTSIGTSTSNQVPGPETFAQYDQYKTSQTALFADIIVGTGTEVTTQSKVAITYKGWLTNGQLFDQSKSNTNGSLEPFVFTLGSNQVIPGMEQDIVGMKLGGTRRMIIPPAAGYGAQGNSTIPGNSVLVFDVKLVAVE